jgi:hypothetical protein
MVQLCAKMTLGLSRSLFQMTDKTSVHKRELLKFSSSGIMYRKTTKTKFLNSFIPLVCMKAQLLNKIQTSQILHNVQ